MRIGFVTLSTDSWGAESTLLSLASALSQRHPNSELLLLAPEGEFARRWIDTGVGKWVELRLSPRTGTRARLGRDIVRARRAIELHLTGCDVIHSHHQWTHPALALAKVHAQKVVDIHDSPRTRMGRLFQSIAASRMSAVFIASNGLKASLQGSVSQRAILLPRPVALTSSLRSDDHFERVDKSIPGIKIVIVARPDPWKKVPQAVRAVVSGMIEGDELEVVGGDEADYEQSLHASPRGIVRYMGKMSGQHTLEAIRTADINILSAPNEPFGRVVIEAAGCEVPSIVFRTAGVAEDVLAHGAGWVITSFAEIPGIMSRTRQGERINAAKLRHLAEAFHPDRVAQIYDENLARISQEGSTE